MRYATNRKGKLIDDVAGNADAADRTAIIETDIAHRVRWTAKLDYVAATALHVDCYSSVDGGDNYGLVQSELISSGAATLSDYQQQKASGSGDVSMDGWIDCEATTHVKVILTAVGGTAADKLTLICAVSEYR